MGTNGLVFAFLVTIAFNNLCHSLPISKSANGDKHNHLIVPSDITTNKTRLDKTKDSNAIPHDECNLSEDLIKEIANYKPIVERIIDTSVNGLYKGRTWRTLARFVDKFGSRIAGSENLENAIDYMVDQLKTNQLENVHTEPALVPKWVRGRESCWLITPRLEKLKILGLGSSIGTPSKGITAQAIVVSSFEELAEKGEQVYFQSQILNYLNRNLTFI